MPRVEAVLEAMGTAKLFTTLDLKKGYYQVLVEPEHQTKTTFITEFGKYQFRVMPFGLRNAPATFQRLMDLVLKDTTNFAKCYIDDISVYSQAWTQHIDHIREVFTSLQTAGLTLQLSKCKLGAQSCEFLGLHVSAGAISPQTAKVEAITNFRRPLQKKDVRSFLGLIGYYRRYIPQFSSLAAPLSDLTKAQEPDTIKWTDQCQLSFENLKQVLSTPPTLAAPDYSKPFLLQTDASDRGIGAVLSQDHDQEEKPVAFFSRKLLDRNVVMTPQRRKV